MSRSRHVFLVAVLRFCVLCLLPLCGAAEAVCHDEVSGEKPAEPAELPEFSVQLREDVVYCRVGERELLLDAFLPQVEGPVPAVIVIHGGAWRSGNPIGQSPAVAGLCGFAGEARYGVFCDRLPTGS